LYPLDALPPTAVVPEKELPVAMSKKLFVGGLSWGTTDDGLHSAFSQFGEIVEAKVITDRETGRSRGFGFVTYSADDSAAKAIAEMDGTELDGRTIKVNEAEDKPARSGGGGGGGRGGYGGGRGGRSGGGGGGGRGGRGRDEW
jgi:RNA recognition motif-containing protein